MEISRNIVIVLQLIDRFAVPKASKSVYERALFAPMEIEQAQLQAVMDSDVDMLACGIGAPSDVVAEAKDRGKTTLALIGSPHHVPKAVAAGVEIIVAQGYDAGAHTPIWYIFLWFLKSLTPPEIYPCLLPAVWRQAGILQRHWPWAPKVFGWARPGFCRRNTKATCIRSTAIN